MFKPFTILSHCYLLVVLIACTERAAISKVKEVSTYTPIDGTSLVVLGTIQDAGSPQMGCAKDCCAGLFEHPDPSRQVSSLGVIDSNTGKNYLFDATPDITSQIKLLTGLNLKSASEVPDGIFLTHAHIGHYTGLMYLGKEAIDAKLVKVYTMPRMTGFLANNGPWNMLVSRENIELQEMQDEKPIALSNSLTVTPFLVPHRDEFSETVGYTIQGPSKSALFIPDIDKWDVWETSIIAQIKKVDYAFIDATFYDAQELNNRDISEIPHPFVIESLATFSTLTKEDKSKVIFTHFNHTNPLVDPQSDQSKHLISLGYSIARRGDLYAL